MSKRLTGSISAGATLKGFINAPASLKGILTIPSAVGVDVYDGDYTFTPTAETQTIAIDHKMATANITIDPIPSNWGLITWNGSALTVS